MAHAKEIEGLDYDATATDGARLIIAARLTEMCDYRAAALDWSDIEGVHDMRVASRRLRSILQDFAPYFRKRAFHRMRDAIKEIADALGGVRDHDVAIDALAALAAEAPEDTKAGVERLADERRRQREPARVKLAAVVTEEHTATLLRDALATLKTVPARRRVKGSTAPVAELSLRDAGRHIIGRHWRRLSDASDSLKYPLKSKPLHAMRIDAKKFRYALELFAPGWSDALTPFAKEVAELQSSLGDVHDCDEWIEMLGKRLRTLERQRDDFEGAPMSTTVRAEDRRAVVWLLGHFVKSRAKHFRAALERWHAWDEAHFATNLETVLDTPPRQSEPHHAGQSTA